MPSLSEMSPRMIAASGIAIVAMGVGAYLIHDHFAAIPPDPLADEPEVVLDFFLSDYYDRLSPAEQQRYVRRMLENYMDMDEAQRERAEQAVAERRDDEQLQDRMIDMWRTYVVSEAEEYVQLDPDERPRWIARRMAVWQAFGGGPPGDGDRERPDLDRVLSSERQQQAVSFFQGQILPRSSGRERALVSILARDVMDMYGNR